MKSIIERMEKSELKRKECGMSKDNWNSWNMLKSKMFSILLWLGLGAFVYFTGGNIYFTFVIIIGGVGLIWWMEVMLFDRMTKRLDKMLIMIKAEALFNKWREKEYDKEKRRRFNRRVLSKE